MKQRSWLISLFSISLGFFLLTGCPPKNKLSIEEKPKVDKPEAEEGEETATSESVPGEVEITQDWTEIPALQPVHFDYDAASLSEGARLSLKNNVTILKRLPKTVTIRVEGHCDDRGTVEYNIALGQRRANAVRSYYSTAGLSKSRLETISFGEERLVCTDQTEDCWTRNRRGVTKVRNSENIKIKPEDLR